nr:FtsW/RodA/SpoVE family cell cycle protein [Armatimonadota bacterium]
MTLSYPKQEANHDTGQIVNVLKAASSQVVMTVLAVFSPIPLTVFLQAGKLLRRMRYYPRLLELLLLLIAMAMTGVAFLSVYRAIAPDHPINAEALRIALPMGAFLAAHWLLSFTRPRANQALLPIVAALTGIGLVFLYRVDASLTQHGDAAGVHTAPAHHFDSQAVMVLLGMALLLGLANLRNVKQLSRYKYLCMVFGIGLLLATAVAGKVVHEKALAIRIGPLEFQPTELV